MRRFIAAAAIASVLAVPRVASSTCDACCERRATLAGWSADGRAVAVIFTFEDGEQILEVSTPRATRSWGAYAADQPECVGELEALPGALRWDAREIDVRTWRPLRRHALEPVDAAWRTAFAGAIEVVPVGRRTFARDPFRLGLAPGEACTAWELRDAGGKVVATLPRVCELAGSLGRLDVPGGYLHPGGTTALVEVRLHRERLVVEERFVSVPL